MPSRACMNPSAAHRAKAQARSPIRVGIVATPFCTVTLPYRNGVRVVARTGIAMEPSNVGGAAPVVSDPGRQLLVRLSITISSGRFGRFAGLVVGALDEPGVE